MISTEIQLCGSSSLAAQRIFTTARSINSCLPNEKSRGYTRLLIDYELIPAVARRMVVSAGGHRALVPKMGRACFPLFPNCSGLHFERVDLLAAEVAQDQGRIPGIKTEPDVEVTG